jgi:hypothetical protein
MTLTLRNSGEKGCFEPSGGLQLKTKSFSVLEEPILSDPVRAARAEVALKKARAEYEEYQVSLAELRRAQSVTELQIAEKLGVTAAKVSEIEQQADLYLQALRDQIAVIGGELELTCRFENGARLPVSFHATGT